MTYGFTICTCLIIIVLQTVIIPDVQFLSSCFDLTAIFVIYLGLLRSLREGLPAILLLGLIMDNLSGAPLMVFTSAYLWLYFGVRWLTGILQVGMRFRLAFIVVSGILLENLILFLSFDGLDALEHLPSSTLVQIVPRLIWASILGPVMVLVLERLHKIWNRWAGAFAARRSAAEHVRPAR